MLWPWISTSATRPSSTACMKRVKLISGARGCCLLTMDHRISPIRSNRSQSPRLRETGFKDTSANRRGTYHVVFPWAMHGSLSSRAGPASALEDAAHDEPGLRADGRDGRACHAGNPDDAPGRLDQGDRAP